MAAKEFTKAEWAKIRRRLNQDPVHYGLPQREYGSVVIGSFNIRKLGALKGPRKASGRDEATMQFLADVGRHFDLLAVQEVLPEMTAVRKLRDLMGPQFSMVISDVIGTFPGESGNEERLAFIYNTSIVKRTDLVTEVTASRTKVLKGVARTHKELFDLMDSNTQAKSLRNYYDKTLPNYQKAVRAGSTRRRPKEPKFSIAKVPFLQFIRTPFAAGFQVVGHPGLERYEFIAVNAHLHYGRPADRRAEAVALVEWILGKAQGGENVLLLGDLNFDYDKPASDFERIRTRFEEIGGFADEKGKKIWVSFPFIFPHPRPKQNHPPNKVFRTNIALNQTFDQVGIFSPDARVGNRIETTVTGHSKKEQWGQPGGPDYGVFDFSTLFSDVLGKSGVQFRRRFEHKVSDHMPTWIRIPLPRVPEGGKFPLKT